MTRTRLYILRLAIGIGGIAVAFLLLQQIRKTEGDGMLQQPASSIQYEQLAQISFETYSGVTVTLDDIAQGKPLVVNAWASWCPFCVEELPAFVAVQKALEGDVSIVAVNRGEPLAIAKQYTDDAGISEGIMFVLDTNDALYGTIGGFSMPETLFIASDGTIVFHKRGPMREEEIMERAAALE